MPEFLENIVPHWFLSSGVRTPEYGIFCKQLVNLLHVDRYCRWYTFRFWEYWTVCRHLVLHPHDVVLDTGSWRTYIPLWFAFQCETWCVDNKQFGGHVTDDLSWDEWSRALTTEAHTNYPVIVLEDDLRDLQSIKAEAVDVMTSFSVLEHIDDGGDAKASREAWRVLKPGGLFVGTVDYGPPEESVPMCRKYTLDTFQKRIVETAPWEWIIGPPPDPGPPAKGSRSAMAFFLRKQVT